jgi:hypothetical protein
MGSNPSALASVRPPRVRCETAHRVGLAIILAIAVPLGTVIGWFAGVSGRRDVTPLLP